MAWFNNTESQGEENVVQPVSFQRLQSLVARNGPPSAAAPPGSPSSTSARA